MQHRQHSGGPEQQKQQHTVRHVPSAAFCREKRFSAVASSPAPPAKSIGLWASFSLSISIFCFFFSGLPTHSLDITT